MPRFRRYVEANVLDEARRRVAHIYEAFDAVVVAFSGGKDSLAVLHLAREHLDGRAPVHAVFRDEEVIHEEVLDFVAELADEPWLDLAWWCVPLRSTKFVMGQVVDYVQWDPGRQWVRPMPEHGLREADLGIEPGTVLDQRTADALTARPYRGRVCIMTGVRASESILRYRSCVNKLNENYIVASSSDRAQLGRPIFDWQEDDVFRYFYDLGVPYCPIYDAQTWADVKLRVNTGLPAESAKTFDTYQRYSPDLYDRIVAVFPEMATQARYFAEMDASGTRDRYGQSLDTVREWIVEHVTDPAQLTKALREWKAVRVRSKINADAYPPRYVLSCFMSQNGQRTVLPIKGESHA